MINDSLKIISLVCGLKKWLKIDLIYLKGLTMENNELKKIAGLIRKDWEEKTLDVEAVENYARLYGYCYSTAKEFIFDEYLESFSERGKPTYQWNGLVDSVMLANGYQLNTLYDMTDLDYEIIWGYINKDIIDTVENNKEIDRPILKKIESFKKK